MNHGCSQNQEATFLIGRVSLLNTSMHSAPRVVSLLQARGQRNQTTRMPILAPLLPQWMTQQVV